MKHGKTNIAWHECRMHGVVNNSRWFSETFPIENLLTVKMFLKLLIDWWSLALFNFCSGGRASSFWHGGILVWMSRCRCIYQVVVTLTFVLVFWVFFFTQEGAVLYKLPKLRLSMRNVLFSSINFSSKATRIHFPPIDYRLFFLGKELRKN